MKKINIQKCDKCKKDVQYLWFYCNSNSLKETHKELWICEECGFKLIKEFKETLEKVNTIIPPEIALKCV